jgi:signal transduction histidine kinase/DNA-binding response OmpR family regulator
MPLLITTFCFTLASMCVLPITAFANQQSPQDSLLQVIASAQADTIKAKGYIKLADWNNYSNALQAVEYAQKAIDISLPSRYHHGIATGYERLGNAWFQLGENEKAAQNYRKARTANEKLGSYEIDASVYYNLGNIQNELGNFDSAIYYADEAGKVFLAHGDSMGYGASRYLAASEYQSKGNYELGTKNILEALEIFQRKGVQEWEIYALNMLVEIYNVQKKYDESLQILNTCLRYHRKTDNKKFMAITYRFMGDIYLSLNDLDMAFSTLDSSYQIVEQYGFKQEKGKTMHSLGQLYFLRQQYPEALQMFQDGLTLAKDQSDELFQCANFLGIGNCLFEQGIYPAAIENLYQSVQLAQKINDPYRLRDGYLALSKNYEALDQPLEALQNFKQYKQASDSIAGQENKKQFAELASRYDTQKKEEQISLLEQEATMANAYSTRVMTLWAWTVAVGILAVLILVFAYYKNRQLLANEKKLDKIKSRFFANISHEFRTPLTLIIGPLQDLLKKPEAVHFQEDLQMMQQQAQRLLTLINQILDLSKLDAGKYALHVAQADMVGSVQSTVLAFLSLAEMKDVQLLVQADREELIVHYDATNLQTILNNLLSNALKFEPEGGEVLVKLQSDEVEKKQKVKLSVINSGTYIPADECQAIFDRFYQASDEQKAAHGSGIGLALTQELVELHGGTIDVESSRSHGTTFKVTLPTNLPLAQAITTQGHNTAAVPYTPKSSDAIPPPAAHAGSPVVLIIEDHPEVLNYIRSVLHEYHIVTAPNGQQGIDMALKLIPDIIISDVMMPVKDGIEVTAELKKNLLSSHIPIILLTAKASLESRLEGLEVQADVYLTKPFNADELKLTIKSLLGNRRRLQEKYAQRLMLKPQETEVKSLDQVFLEKICHCIEENIGNELYSVEKLAQEVGISRSQLHRKLEALTGKPATRFIREYRLERAYHLVAGNSATIAEISYQVGFNSPGYFTKCFKDYFHHTPGEVRTQAQD